MAIQSAAPASISRGHGGRRDGLGPAVSGERVNVRDFGAKGDGRTIDTLAINRAITACAPGQTLYFPSGIYLVDNSDMRDNGAHTTIPLGDGVNVFMEKDAWMKRHPSERKGVYFLAPTSNNILQVNVDGDEIVDARHDRWSQAQCIGVNGADCKNVTVVNSHFKNLTYGVRTRGASGCRLHESHFRQIRLSGVLMQAAGMASSIHNEVVGCTFENMGDTAAAFHVTDRNGVCAHNRVDRCIAKNTQLRALGFAFDFEGGFEFGKIHNNAITGCKVEQTAVSALGQGGITMNRYSEDSIIAGNSLIGNLHQAHDVGIMIPDTRGIKVLDNYIEKFRGGAINADGAESAVISRNQIRNSGDATIPGVLLHSAIVLGYVSGSRSCLVDDNVIEWSVGYPFGGENAAAIAARRYEKHGVADLTIRNNKIRNALGHGIMIVGFGEPGYQLQNVQIEYNELTDDSPGRVPGRKPVVARYIHGLRMEGNVVGSGRREVDLTGSTGSGLLARL
ncbi:hypothetical protein FHS95_001238 [Sphingomonas naasensis]|nr:right-handed parallel beta-helix repeat-containing protein [Sphingomonas naasensis]NIJ19569.1 hypothetical protein [Sphingomonas naasensis]